MKQTKLIIELPEKTRKDFKLKCIQNDTTMKTIVYGFILKYLGGEKL